MPQLGGVVDTLNQEPPDLILYGQLQHVHWLRPVLGPLLDDLVGDRVSRLLPLLDRKSVV